MGTWEPGRRSFGAWSLRVWEPGRLGAWSLEGLGLGLGLGLALGLERGS